jgi:hypothetical protein
MVGLLAGVFLALLLPQSLLDLPLSIATYTEESGSNKGLSAFESMARVLRSIARGGVGGYKSPWVAPSSPSISHLAASSSLKPSPKLFSTTAATMSNQKTFFDAVKERRSYYQLNKEAPISDKQITDIVEQAVLHVPSSFNAQSARLVVLLNKDHDTFWDFVLEILKPLTPEENFPKTEQKIKGFQGAYGTVSLISPPFHLRLYMQGSELRGRMGELGIRCLWLGAAPRKFEPHPRTRNLSRRSSLIMNPASFTCSDTTFTGSLLRRPRAS